MYKQIKNKYADMLAVILSIAIVFSSFSFRLVPIASAATLPAPQSVQVTGVTHNSISLEWDPVAGVDANTGGYQVKALVNIDLKQKVYMGSYSDDMSNLCSYR